MHAAGFINLCNIRTISPTRTSARWTRTASPTFTVKPVPRRVSRSAPGTACSASWCGGIGARGELGVTACVPRRNRARELIGPVGSFRGSPTDNDVARPEPSSRSSSRFFLSGTQTPGCLTVVYRQGKCVAVPAAAYCYVRVLNPRARHVVTSPESYSSARVFFTGAVALIDPRAVMVAPSRDWPASETPREFGERCREQVVRCLFGRDSVVSAAEVLHERVTGRDDVR